MFDNTGRVLDVIFNVAYTRSGDATFQQKLSLKKPAKSRGENSSRIRTARLHNGAG